MRGQKRGKRREMAEERKNGCKVRKKEKKPVRQKKGKRGKRTEERKKRDKAEERKKT